MQVINLVDMLIAVLKKKVIPLESNYTSSTEISTLFCSILGLGYEISIRRAPQFDGKNYDGKVK